MTKKEWFVVWGGAMVIVCGLIVQKYRSEQAFDHTCTVIDEKSGFVCQPIDGPSDQTCIVIDEKSGSACKPIDGPWVFTEFERQQLQQLCRSWPSNKSGLEAVSIEHGIVTLVNAKGQQFNLNLNNLQEVPDKARWHVRYLPAGFQGRVYLFMTVKDGYVCTHLPFYLARRLIEENKISILNWNRHGGAELQAYRTASDQLLKEAGLPPPTRGEKTGEVIVIEGK